jgi:UDP-N-acetylmuramoyl-tripeptide--D-alanyl-D-alanine ligase
LTILTTGIPLEYTRALSFYENPNAKRRVYVTPGLVELGDKSAGIHEYIGQKIAISADMVVLMKNSTTKFIEKAFVRTGGFSGELLIVDNPLRFYENLDQFVAKGDVVLMQNDWTDNYA